MSPTPKPLDSSHQYQRASDLLKMPAGEWIDKLRFDGISWRHIANELYLVTKGRMHANETTLMRWHAQWQAEDDAPTSDPAA